MAASKDAILMVEGEAKEVSEEVMLDAFWFGQEQIQPIIQIQEELMQRYWQTQASRHTRN